MKTNKKIRVILICDLKAWVLGYIAQNLSLHLNERCSELEVSFTECPATRREFFKLISKNDVVHLLFPLERPDIFPIDKPTVGTWHHHLDHSLPALNCYFANIDVCCVPNQSELLWVLSNEEACGKTPVYLTPYGIDASTYSHNNISKTKFMKEHDIPLDSILLGFSAKKTSNPEDRKGLNYLWPLLSFLNEHIKTNIRIVIYGPKEGDYISLGWSMEDIPEGLRDIVIFPGFTKAAPDYSVIDYYICLSRYEGGPYPVLESMAQGCVVFSTAVGTAAEVIKDGKNGFFIDYRNYINKVYNTIERLEVARDEKQRIGENAMQYMTQNRGWEKIINIPLMINMYNKAIMNYKRRPLYTRVKTAIINKLNGRPKILVYNAYKKVKRMYCHFI